MVIIPKESEQELSDLILVSYDLRPIVNERQIYESEKSQFTASKIDLVHEVRYNSVMPAIQALDKIETQSNKPRMKYIMKEYFSMHKNEIPCEWENTFSKAGKDV